MRWKAELTAGLIAVAGLFAQAGDNITLQDDRILWLDTFECSDGEFGWDVKGLSPTRESLGLRLNLDDEKGAAPTMSCNIPLRLADVRDEVIYSQIYVSEVGGDKKTMWHLPGTGAGYNPGHHPGLWTVPFKMKPTVAKEYYRVSFVSPGYVTLRFIRLVTGDTPLPGSALWQRDGAPDWTRPICKGDSLRIIANLGSCDMAPTVNVVGSSFNFYQPVDLAGAGGFTTLTLNDSGLDGDMTSGDGLWTATVTFGGKKAYKAGVITAAVRFGSGESDVTYAKAAWPFQADAVAAKK